MRRKQWWLFDVLPKVPIFAAVCLSNFLCIFYSDLNVKDRKIQIQKYWYLPWKTFAKLFFSNIWTLMLFDTHRTLTDNMVVGVSKGFEKRLQLVGVGYRANVEGKDLVLSLGFSHPVRMAIPATLQVKVEENTRIVVSGFDKCSIGEFAASIRRWRPPEPYKGKGVRYANEIIRLKEGKAGKKKWWMYFFHYILSQVFAHSYASTMWDVLDWQ